MEVFITSSILNAAEQFAFMQNTLLLQIFRETIPNGKGENGSVPRYSPSISKTVSCANAKEETLYPVTPVAESVTLSGSVSPNPFSNASSLSSPSPSSSPLPPFLSYGCPTCVAFNNGKCCQNDNGLSIFQDFRGANMNCYWDGKLSDAIANLK